MGSHHVVAVRPTTVAVPPVVIPSLKQVLPLPALSSTEDRYVFVLRPSQPLPSVDLSLTPARSLMSDSLHRTALGVIRNHFHHYVRYFRFGISCFALLLFVSDDLWRILIIIVMIPANLSLISTAFFLSNDILRLLLRSYDFYFATIINALNWIALSVVLGDKRAVATLLGWFGMQIVITVDASYRTFPTAIGSMGVGIPVVLVLFVLVSLRSINGAHFFKVNIHGQRVYDAADIMGFTSFTLAIVLAKFIFLKRRRVLPPIGGPGYYRIPCAAIKVTLRFVQGTSQRGQLLVSPQIDSASARRLQSSHDHQLRRSAPPIQQLILSPLKIDRIDARNTLLPFAQWEKRSTIPIQHQNVIRLVFYGIGAVGYGSLIFETARSFQSHIGTGANTASAPNECVAEKHSITGYASAVLACACSLLFCGTFALFFHRDLLWLLLTNFDYVFSIVQVVTYQYCLLDMMCWDVRATLSITSWTMWLTWALTIDTLTPLVKKTIFRLPSKLAAFVLASALLSGLSTTYVIIFIKGNGLRDRTVMNVALSSGHSFALTTKSILLGRAATISLWSTRQVVVLFTRREDELLLIRGLVEYESPYGLLPHKLNKCTPALPDVV